MSGVTLDLRISEPAWTEIDAVETLCARALDAGAGVAPACAGEVSVLLTDDAEMQALNRDWRDKDKPTDVLSFPSGGMPEGFLGDIALGYGTCTRDAGERGLKLGDHLSHLLVHGLLHLAGHDHERDDDASIMQGLETKALARLGLHDPYSG